MTQEQNKKAAIKREEELGNTEEAKQEKSNKLDQLADAIKTIIIYHVMAPKGGAGKSHFCQLLMEKAINEGRDIGVFDGDEQNPDVVRAFLHQNIKLPSLKKNDEKDVPYSDLRTEEGYEALIDALHQTNKKEVMIVSPAGDLTSVKENMPKLFDYLEGEVKLEYRVYWVISSSNDSSRSLVEEVLPSEFAGNFESLTVVKNEFYERADESFDHYDNNMAKADHKKFKVKKQNLQELKIPELDPSVKIKHEKEIDERKGNGENYTFHDCIMEHFSERLVRRKKLEKNLAESLEVVKL